MLQSIKNNIACTELTTEPDRILCTQKVALFSLIEFVQVHLFFICARLKLLLLHMLSKGTERRMSFQVYTYDYLVG